jgi:hypothetical protein
MTTNCSLSDAALKSGHTVIHPSLSYTAHSPSNLRGAKKRLIETHPNSELSPNNCNHNPLTISNSNSTLCFSRSSLQLPAIQHPESNRSWYRLEINISPTKQRTEVLSNRPISADPARIGVLRDQRESKDLSSVNWRQITARNALGRAGIHPRRKPVLLCSCTACADSPAKSPPYEVPRHSPLAASHRISNRSWYRLEINISPTKQRTEVLSNRS